MSLQGNAFLIGPATLTILLTSCVQAFKIPSGGMERTLPPGDHLLVDKAAYGSRIPYLGSTVVCRRDPQRGDLVAFLYPEDRVTAAL